MCRLLSLFLLTLFLWPPAASAEAAGGPYARYCHGNHSDIFTGIARDAEGRPKINLAVGHAFNERMKRERFTPDILPIAPIYDLAVTVVPTVNEYCLSQYDKDGHFIQKVDPPKTLPFRASIELGGRALISASSLEWKGARDDAGEPVYEWHIKGWPNGIVSESKMERLIRAIHDNKPPPQLVVKAAFADGRDQREETDAGFTACAPVWGSGAHEVVYARVAHRLSDFIYQASSVVSEAFLKVDPFKAYQKEFAHVFNLNNYQGKSWFNIHAAAALGILPLARDCGGDKAIHIAISPLVPPGDFASAISGGRFIQVASDVTKRIVDINERNIHRFIFMVPMPLIALHEFGHAFGGLHDEYTMAGSLQETFKPTAKIAGLIGKNCSDAPASDWVFNDTRYGNSNFEGCTFAEGSYRPSSASIMRGAQSGETRFNVVSCGYLIAAIKGGNGPEYWPECMNPNWNTIKPVSAAVSFSSWLHLASLFQALSQFTPPVASVEGAVEGGQNIYIDHMSADGALTGETLTVPAISYVQPPLADVPAEKTAENENPAVTATTTAAPPLPFTPLAPIPRPAGGDDTPSFFSRAVSFVKEMSRELFRRAAPSEMSGDNGGAAAKPPPPPSIQRAAEGSSSSRDMGKTAGGNVGIGVAPPQSHFPELELHGDKLNRLRESILNAIDEFQRKRRAAGAAKKGGEAFANDPSVDGTLYLLQKMYHELEANPDGSLKQSMKDPAGYNKFFVHLKALKAYDDPALEKVFQFGDELTGFSYLFPPSLDKPNLVFIPGASGEATTYAGIALLREESNNFNIIGYDYDATLPESQMMDALTREFSKEKLNSDEHVLLLMSMGNTVAHGAILSTLGNPDTEGLFRNSHVISVGFLPGGSAKFLGKPKFVPELASAVFPPYAAIFHMMNPANPLQSDIARNMRDISAATKGISYIQANHDPHVDQRSTDRTYATNRDLVFREIKANTTFITPPAIFEKHNPHINMFDPSPSSEVRRQIEGLRGQLQKKPRTSLPKGLAVKHFLLLQSDDSALAAAAAFEEDRETGAFDAMRGLFGSALPSECASLTEVLEDALATQGTADYSATAQAVKRYMSLTGATCDFDEIEKAARNALASEGGLPEELTTAIKEPPPPPPAPVHRQAGGDDTPSFFSRVVSFVEKKVNAVLASGAPSEKSEDVSLEMLNLDSAALETNAKLETIGSPTETLESADKEMQKYFLSGEGGSVSSLSRAILSRYKAMLLLAKTDPETFFKYATVKTIREKLPPLLQKYIEKELSAQGILNVYHIDDFKHYKNSRYEYEVLIGKNLLSLTPSQPLPLRSGTRIALKGYQLGSHLVSKLQDIKILSEPPLDTIGDQKTLVLLVNYQNDKAEPFTPDEARNFVFNGRFQDFMKTQSYDKVSFSGDVYGWWTIPEDEPTAPNCAGGVSINRVLPFLRANNVDLTAYGRVLFFFPKGWACSSIGKAAELVEGKVYHVSEAWIMGGFDHKDSLHKAFTWTKLDGVLAHEMGHGLGLQHANAWVCREGDSIYGDCGSIEYGNPYDTMGRDVLATALEYNAMYKRELNWLTSTDEVAITGSGEYTISPLENEHGKRVAHIVAPGGNEYFIEYRRPIDYDGDIAQMLPGGPISGLFINRKFKGWDDSRLIDATPKTLNVYDQDLRGDTVFTDTGEGVSIGPVPGQDNEHISFRVTFGNAECAHSKPKIFITPIDAYPSYPVDTYVSVYVHVTNMDSPSCSPSLFSVQIASTTALWEIVVPSLFPETVSLDPGKSAAFVYTVTVPPRQAAELNHITWKVTSDAGHNAMFERFITAVPYDIESIEPAVVSPGQTFTIRLNQAINGVQRKILIRNKSGLNDFNPPSNTREMRIVAPKTLWPCTGSPTCKEIPAENGSYDVFVSNWSYKDQLGKSATITFTGAAHPDTLSGTTAATTTEFIFGTSTSAFNLRVASTTILGSPGGGENRFYAGETTIRADIVNDGPEILKTFGNTIEYRAKGATDWISWIQFDVAGLVKGGHIRARHIWQSKPGDWEFRVVTDSGDAIPESNEDDNYSPIMSVSIISPPGAKISHNVPVWAKPRVRLLPVKIQGESAGSGRFYADSAVISGAVRNAGDAPSAPARGLFQISSDGRVWSNWLGASIPSLGPDQAGHTISYYWTGGAGVRYFRFGVELPDSSVKYSRPATAGFVER